MKKVKTSKASRFLSLGTALAKASGSYVLEKAKAKVDSEKLAAAEKIIGSMSDLKGGWMKIGQMLSLTESEILPKEISDMFKVLQKDSEPLAFDRIEKILVRELGEKYLDHFSSFDKVSHASASIGQVHKAVLKNGKMVAVKIQYDGIETAIKNDMSSVDQIDKVLSLMFKKKPNFKLLLNELQETLILECNYIREANQQKFFKQKLEAEFDNIYVPEVIEELCTKRVLVSEWVEGDSFESSLEYDQASRNRLGEVLYNSFLYSFFTLGKIHADPQNGNFLFKGDKIIFLDFGCIKDFDSAFIENYALLQHSVEANDLEIYRYAAQKLNIIQAEDDEQFVLDHFQLVKNVYEPYINKGVYQADFPNALGLIRDFIFQVDWKERIQPDKNFVLLDRNNIGLFMKLKKWQPAIDWDYGRQKYRAEVLKTALGRFQAVKA